MARCPKAASRRIRADQLTLAACSAGTGPADADERARLAGARYSARVVNDGAVELTDVVVHVSDRDSVRVARLAPGAATALAAMSVVHETPAVRAKVGGQLRALIPVEGFAGFNPEREPGRYTIGVAAGAGDHELAVRMRRD